MKNYLTLILAAMAMTSWLGAADNDIVANQVNASGKPKATKTIIHYAAADPTGTDDANDGYVVGTVWVNTGDDGVYVLADATAGLAVWTEVTGGAGGAPTDATYITQTANGTLSNEQALSGLTTGVVKVTNGTGVLSTASAGTDYQAPLTAGTNGVDINALSIDLDLTEFPLTATFGSGATAGGAWTFNNSGTDAVLTINDDGSFSFGTINATNLTITNPLTSLAIDTNGVVLDTDGDGMLIITGASGGYDEDLRLNLDDVENTGTFTSTTALATLNFSSIALQESGVGVLNNDEIDASTELAAIMDDETGSGLLVFGTSPSFVTDISIGNAAASAGTLKILEDTDDGSNYASFTVPALAANTVYTLPADDGDAGEQLQTNGSGVLSWEAAGGAGATAWDDIGDPDADGTIQFAGYEQTITSTLDEAAHTILTITDTDADSANATTILKLSHNDGADADVTYLSMIGDADGTPTTDYAFTQSAFTLGKPMQLTEDNGIALDSAISADTHYSGITIAGTAGYDAAFGDIVTLDKDDSRWEAVDISVAAAATGDARGILGVCVNDPSGDGQPITVLLQGNVNAAANFTALTIGAAVFASTTGDVAVSAPSTEDYVIRVVGFALSGDELYFCPSSSWATYDAP